MDAITSRTSFFNWAMLDDAVRNTLLQNPREKSLKETNQVTLLAKKNPTYVKLTVEEIEPATSQYFVECFSKSRRSY